MTMKRASFLWLKCELFFTWILMVDNCRFLLYNKFVPIGRRPYGTKKTRFVKIFVPKMCLVFERALYIVDFKRKYACI